MESLPLSNRSNMIILQYLNVKQLCNDIPNDIKYRNKIITDVLTFQLSRLSDDAKKDSNVLYQSNNTFEFFIEFFFDYIDDIVNSHPSKIIKKMVDMFQIELDYKSNKRNLNNKLIDLINIFKEENELEELFEILFVHLDMNKINKIIKKELNTESICNYF